MNKEDRDIHRLAPLKDVVAICVTVAACTFLLTVASMFTKTSEISAYTAAALSTPSPPPPLILVQVPEPGLPSADVALVTAALEGADVLTDIEFAWTPPEIDELLALPQIEKIRSLVDTITSIPQGSERAASKETTPFQGIIVQVAGRYEVDPHLIRAIILAESGYNPKAKSKKGARGLMQLMPSTAKSLGVQNIYDPEENIDGGVRYFRSLLDRFDGDVQLALAAYNAGSRHVRNYEGIPPFKATQHYIKKVLKFREKFKTQKAGRSRRLA